MAKDHRSTKEEEEYEVEYVVDDRIRHTSKKKQYFIKWKNYPESDNTWEPEENLNCPELIAQYERKKCNDQNKEKLKVTKKSDGGRRPRLASVSSKPLKRSASASLKSSSSKRPKSLSTNGSERKERIDEPKVEGFARGLKPIKIVGATEKDGELKFLVKWEGCNESDIVPAREANIRCPQQVIDFYEDRLMWHSVDDRSKN